MAAVNELSGIDIITGSIGSDKLIGGPVNLAGDSDIEKLIVSFDIDADRNKHPILQVAGLLATSIRDGGQSIVSLLQELGDQSLNSLPVIEAVDNDAQARTFDSLDFFLFPGARWWMAEAAAIA